MRLLLFAGRVKFRRRHSFRWNFPTFIQSGSPGLVGSLPPPNQEPRNQSQDSPAASRQEPGPERVSPAQRPLPLLVELRDSEPSRRPHTCVEIIPIAEPLKKRPKRVGGVPPGQLGDRGDG